MLFEIAPSNFKAFTVFAYADHALREIGVLAPEAVDPDDVEMLQDMIVAAVNEAIAQADKESEELMGKMTGGLGF